MTNVLIMILVFRNVYYICFYKQLLFDSCFFCHIVYCSVRITLFIFPSPHHLTNQTKVVYMSYVNCCNNSTQHKISKPNFDKKIYLFLSSLCIIFQILVRITSNRFFSDVLDNMLYRFFSDY